MPIAFLDQERRSSMVPRHWTIVDITRQNTALYSPNGSIAQYCGQIELGEPMLAAMPSEADKRLELFRLALLLSSKNKAALPPALEAYFNAVLFQARLLILHPDRIANLQTPQAIQLANEMRSNERLRELLEGIENLDGMSRELAERALSTLEPDLASAD
jgi:hypothetical protein